MRRILFVDDEPNVLQGLQRMLRPMRNEWQMAFAAGGQEALAILERDPFDVVVSDMRMPGMNGAQLLGEVMRHYPQVVRIILSGQSDQEAMLRSIGPTHLYLCKPCDSEALRMTIARACALRDLMSNHALQQVIARMESLPSQPAIYSEIVAALQSPDVSVDQVSSIIEKDVGMTAKILQLVNSSFFGLHRNVSGPAQAVSLIGFDMIKTLVLSYQMFSQFDEAKVPKSVVDKIRRHSMAVGKYARIIARSEGLDRRGAEEAFTAGLLHDSGKLVLMANMPSQYAKILLQAQQENRPLAEAERGVLGATHAEVGAYLMGLWGLPDPIVEALAFHHDPMHIWAVAGSGWSKETPSSSPDSEPIPVQHFTPLTATHIANALTYGKAAEETGSDPNYRIDTEYLAALGCEDRLSEWRGLCYRADDEETTV